MNKSGNNVCLVILVIIAIFLMYQLLCKNNNKMSGGDNHASVEDMEKQEVNNNADLIESDTEIDSDTELNFNDPDYRNYEPVIEDPPVDNSVNQMQDNMVENVNTEAENVPTEATNTFDISGLENTDSYYMLNSNEVSDNATNKNNKLNPSELLPADSKNMEGNNFLTASLSKNEQIIGIPTQTQRARKNYDLRSAPPNPQVEVSPWNMSTMEPDTGRLTFEIGQSHCPPCE
jgi:hypothetical protein